MDYEKESCVNFDIEIFYTGESLIDFIKQNHGFDLMFLDIELGTTTAITIGNTIRNEFDDYISKIVFITAKDGYAEQLFDLQPFNFIKKPIDKEKLMSCIKLAIKLLHMENTSFEYKKGHEIIKVNIKDILYFESQRKKIKIVTYKGENYFYETMVNITQRLPKSFVEPHSSFLINFNNIESITTSFVFMKNGAKIPISRQNLKNIRNILINFERER